MRNTYTHFLCLVNRLTILMQVKAQVKLQFCNVRGQVMTAVRSIEATQKSKKVEVKTLTATIGMRDDNGRINTIDG